MKQIIFKKSESIKLFAVLSSFIDSLKSDDKYIVTIKKYRKKRSLDANAYCWVLLDKLAEKVNVPKAEIYRNMIREIGGNSEIICAKNESVKKLCEGWEHNGTGWQTETFKSKVKGCTNVILYYGSSTYDTRQMSRLIDNIAADCKAVGIETMTPQELQSLKDGWKA